MSIYWENALNILADRFNHTTKPPPSYKIIPPPPHPMNPPFNSQKSMSNENMSLPKYNQRYPPQAPPNYFRQMENVGSQQMSYMSNKNSEPAVRKSHIKYLKEFNDVNSVVIIRNHSA